MGRAESTPAPVLIEIELSTFQRMSPRSLCRVSDFQIVQFVVFVLSDSTLSALEKVRCLLRDDPILKAIKRDHAWQLQLAKQVSCGFMRDDEQAGFRFAWRVAAAPPMHLRPIAPPRLIGATTSDDLKMMLLLWLD